VARVLLVLPRLSARVGAPLLGQQHLAACLLEDGHEVRVVDLASAAGPSEDAEAVAAAERLDPDLVGVTVFTQGARRAYALAGRLRGRAQELVAGGPHASACPDEALAHGFDRVVTGEGELALRALVRHLDGAGERPPAVLDAGAVADLDALPLPQTAAGCWEPGWYHPAPTATAGGIVTSRGCPVGCSFCASGVGGRRLRARSPASVVAELTLLRRDHGVCHVPFWDDAFGASRTRLHALCAALRAEADLEGLTWTCTVLADRVRPEDLAALRRTGCVAVNVGVESGDEAISRAAGKRWGPEQALAVVRAAHEEGLTTVANVMFGFPGEGVAELSRTLELLERLAPVTDFFNHRGVLVPYPGTGVYARHHAEHGFSGWWLEPDLPEEPDLAGLPAETVERLLETDPMLDRDFFRYPDPVRELIEQGVRAKAEHNRRTLARLRRR